MVRRSRRWEPHAIHHVVARAHCGGPILATDEDRAFVVKRAARAFAETDATCLGWAILANHYHVLVRCKGPPGRTFARLNTAIAWRTLRHRGDHGSVFQNRFFSDTCDDEAAVLMRLVYVLGNPVHHRIVPTVDALRSYAWSGLGEILGLRESRWTDVGAALALLDPDPDRARQTLLRAIEAKAAEWAADSGDPAEDRRPTDAATADASSNPLDGRPAAPAVAPSASALLGAIAEPATCLRNALRHEGWTPGRLLPVACALTGADLMRVAAGAQTRAEAAAQHVAPSTPCDSISTKPVPAAPSTAPTMFIE
ncbi:MAG: hypothetical protein K8T90_18710 [Planctomycetes bacterium]|nr:hypothetical protein [Planctomycetota bacterium]